MSKVLGPSIVYTTLEAYKEMSSHAATDIYICKGAKKWFVGDVEMSAALGDFDMDSFATDEELAEAIKNFITETDLEPYAKKTALEGLASETYVDDAVADKLVADDLDPYAKSVDVAATYATIEALEALKASASGAFHFRGVEELDIDNLPDDAEPGDVWQYEDKEYAWNGTEWVELGFNIDLSAYKTGADITKEINAAIKAVEEKFNFYDKSTVVDSKIEDGIEAATPEIVEQASEQALYDLFLAVKAAGYKGTRNSFIVALAEVMNEKNNLVVAEGQDDGPAIAGSNLSDLAEALNAVDDGASVSFVADGSLSSNVSLKSTKIDLADHLVEPQNNGIIVSGDVSIKDGSIAENSDIANPANIKPLFSLQEGSALTLENVDIDTSTCAAVLGTGDITLKNVNLTSSLDPSYAATAYDTKTLIDVTKGSITMEDGLIDCTTSSDTTCGLYALAATGGTKITLGNQATGEGPTIKANASCVGTNNLDGGIDDITIYGGNYTTLMSHPQWMGVLYLGASANVEIFGGTFNGGDYDIALPYKPAKYTVKIHGGTFNGGIVIKKDYKNGGKGPDTNNDQDVIEIDGGKFAGKLDSKWIKAGYEQVKVGDYWVVQTAPEDLDGPVDDEF